MHRTVIYQFSITNNMLYTVPFNEVLDNIKGKALH